jgi:hypothetical protein
LIEYANTDPQHVAVAGCACFHYVGDNPQCPEHGKGSEAVSQAQAEAEHDDWLDEQATRESVRP